MNTRRYGAPLPLLGVKTGSALLWGSEKRNGLTEKSGGQPLRETGQGLPVAGLAV